MLKRIRNRHLFSSDVLLLLFASYLSFLLRLEDRDLDDFRSGFLLWTILIVTIVPIVFRQRGVYSRYWRYASVEELRLLISSVTLSVAIASALVLLPPLLLDSRLLVPRSIPLIFLLLALVATAGPRLLLRLAMSRRTPTGRLAGARHVLVVGAGDAGSMIAREIERNAQVGLTVVGFVDDDPTKRGVTIYGVPVLGNRHAIPELVARYDIDRVIIAMPKALGRVIREIVDICEAAHVPARIMPGMYELLGGKVTVNQLRHVEIEDLLRREPVKTDIASVTQLLRGKRVLVTGGGGSIGSELCRQLLNCSPSELIILGHGENSVFEIENELIQALKHRTRGPDKNEPRIRAMIGDIRFRERIMAVFHECRPQFVFHAAAHKHVPLMELNPAEAVTNNVLGTRNVLDAAVAVGVEGFVMISTDKAVNPTSIMGVSKRTAELLVHQTAGRTDRPYVAVRFGNVLGSRGSVVHTFKRQIAAGGPVTLTHPEMKRYFMTIPEAVQLVVQASVLGRGGEVFVLDMGEPVKIVDLARDMIELSGLEVGCDIELSFTGVRPGEKLFEELFVPGENYSDTRHEKIRIAENASSFVPASLDNKIDRLIAAALRDDPNAIRTCFEELVPEYQPLQSRAVGDESLAEQRINLTLEAAGD